MVHVVGPGGSRCMQCIMLARGAQGSNLVNRGESLVVILFCGVRHMIYPGGMLGLGAGVSGVGLLHKWCAT